MIARTTIVLLTVMAACGGAQNGDVFLKEGSAAPAFSVADQHGKTVSLKDLHKDGPVVLTFLRSFW